MVANILPTDTPLTQGVGLKGQTTYFSESSPVAYQIKADEAGSNMVANVLPTDTPSTRGVGSKGQTISFSESSHVAYQISLKTYAAISNAHLSRVYKRGKLSGSCLSTLNGFGSTQLSIFLCHIGVPTFSSQIN